MHTLIELYDERPLENVLGVEMFRPGRVIYVCPRELSSASKVQRKIREYFHYKGLSPELYFEKVNIYDTDMILELLRRIVSRYPGCAIDITGGTDAVLFAAGILCAEEDIPVFTYSRRKNKFYNLRNAPFAAGLPCDLHYCVEDCFRMAGGAMRPGRVDNSILFQYLDDIDPFFDLYLKYRKEWTDIVTYMQKVSKAGADGSVSIHVCGDYIVKGERGSRISAKEDALRDLEQLGFIRNLVIRTGETVSFSFKDKQVRSWLRDVGSVLELYVYKACLDLKLFDDVQTSAVVDWEGDDRENAVTNELDVMCTRGVTPVFISCKTCDVKTEALNELAILSDRFGGQIAKAAIVTSEYGNASMRNRASELGIHVIDLSDLADGGLHNRILEIMKHNR